MDFATPASTSSFHENPVTLRPATSSAPVESRVLSSPQYPWQTDETIPPPSQIAW